MMDMRACLVLALCIPSAATSPLAIKGVIHKSDDPHFQSEKKDYNGNVITPRIVGGRDTKRGDHPFFTRVDHNFFPGTQ
jgi:hypothetical protein